MSGFIEGENRQQSTLFPERIDDYVGEDSPVRVVDVFIDGLDISGLGFKTEASDTGRPGYHPRTMLKIYVYGYLNQVHSSRRLEREAQRNVELMWLTGRLAPDFKTIADFRKNNGEAIRLVCREFVMLCRKVNLLTDTLVAIDGSKFKAVNNWRTLKPVLIGTWANSTVPMRRLRLNRPNRSRIGSPNSRGSWNG
jgi:transposase